MEENEHTYYTARVSVCARQFAAAPVLFPEAIKAATVASLSALSPVKLESMQSRRKDKRVRGDLDTVDVGCRPAG